MDFSSNFSDLFVLVFYFFLFYLKKCACFFQYQFSCITSLGDVKLEIRPKKMISIEFVWFWNSLLQKIKLLFFYLSLHWVFPLMTNRLFGEVSLSFQASESWLSWSCEKCCLYRLLTVIKHFLLNNCTVGFRHQGANRKPHLCGDLFEIQTKNKYTWIIFPIVRKFEKFLV